MINQTPKIYYGALWNEEKRVEFIDHFDKRIFPFMSNTKQAVKRKKYKINKCSKSRQKNKLIMIAKAGKKMLFEAF